MYEVQLLSASDLKGDHVVYLIIDGTMGMFAATLPIANSCKHNDVTLYRSLATTSHRVVAHSQDLAQPYDPTQHYNRPVTCNQFLHLQVEYHPHAVSIEASSPVPILLTVIKLIVNVNSPINIHKNYIYFVFLSISLYL